MIQMIVKERRGNTAWCIPCAEHGGAVEREVCDMCMGYVITYFQCPKCKFIGNFLGHAGDKMRENCNAIFPPFDELKTENPISRVEYHLDEHLL